MQEQTFGFCPVKPCTLDVKLTALGSLPELLPGEVMVLHCLRVEIPPSKVLLGSLTAQVQPRTQVPLQVRWCWGLPAVQPLTPSASWCRDWMHQSVKVGEVGVCLQHAFRPSKLICGCFTWVRTVGRIDTTTLHVCIRPLGHEDGFMSNSFAVV